MANGKSRPPTSNPFEQYTMDQLDALSEKFTNLPCDGMKNELEAVKKTMWKWMGAVSAVMVFAGLVLVIIQIWKS